MREWVFPPDVRTQSEIRKDEWRKRKEAEYKRQANLEGNYTSPIRKWWAHSVAWLSHSIKVYPLISLIGAAIITTLSVIDERSGIIIPALAVIAWVAITPYLARLERAYQSEGQFWKIMTAPETWEKPGKGEAEHTAANPFKPDTYPYKRVEAWNKHWDRNMIALNLVTKKHTASYTHEDAIDEIFLGGPEERAYQKLTNPDGELNYPKILKWTALPSGTGATAEVELPPGQTPRDWKDKTAGIESQFRAYLAEVTHRRDKQGKVYLSLFFSDPLERNTTITKPKAVDLETMTVAIGVNSKGETTTIKPSGNAGMLITGVPGSGKTVTTTLTAASFLQYPDAVNLSISDFKGAGDFAPFKKEGVTVIEDNLDETVIMLGQKRKDMEDRLATMRDTYGTSNFWHLDPAKRPPFEVIIIDEVQELLDTQGANKEDKELMGAATRDLKSLVKKGRAAGYFTILSTQKSTSDSIPTAIRDQMPIRISGRQMTVASTIAALGDLPEGVLSPHEDIAPNQPGRLIVYEGGTTDMVQGFYLDESNLEKSLSHLPG